MTVKLTDRQRQALEHVERAGNAGMKLSQYLRTQGIGLRPIYDALAATRRKGVVASASTAFVARRADSPFVEVRMASPPTLPRSAVVCRVLIGGVAVIECGEWPPAAWLSSVLGCRADAAP
jgi:hypothetical protein